MVLTKGDIQVGTRLRPSYGRKKSNYNTLTELHLVEVTKTMTYIANLVEVKIVEGNSYNSQLYERFYAAETIQININHFDLIEHPKPKVTFAVWF